MPGRSARQTEGCVHRDQNARRSITVCSARRAVRIVAMDREPGLPADVHCFWDLVEAASDGDNDVELDTQQDVPVLRFTGGTTGGQVRDVHDRQLGGATRQRLHPA